VHFASLRGFLYARPQTRNQIGPQFKLIRQAS